MNAVRQSYEGASFGARGSEMLMKRYFRREDHPYNILEREVIRHLKSTDTLLDAGCGRSAPVLSSFKGKAGRLIGVDLVDFSAEARDSGLELVHGDLTQIHLETGSVDGIVSRSVMEHLQDPLTTYREFSRLLKPGGWVIFLTPNLWDYASLIATLIPNRFHAAVVAKTEGRAELDTFPTHYRSNTPGAVRRLARESGFRLESCAHLAQYPNYLMFSAPLFLMGTAYAKLITRFEVLKYLRGWLLVTMVKEAENSIAG